MNNSANGMLGRPLIGGACHRRPVSAAGPLPVNATAALTGFINQGAISTDGVTRTLTKERDTITIWGGDPFLDTVTSQTIEFTFTLVEALNDDVNITVFGDQYVDGVLAYSGAELEQSAWVFNMAHRGNLKRIVVPIAEIVTDSIETVYQDAEVIAYAVTISARRDQDGNFFYEYTERATV